MTRNAEPYVTPKVRATAARNGIDLNTVQGTGAGGRIRLQDVQPAARAAAAPVASATTARASFVQTQASEMNPGAGATIDLYAVNPLLDDFRQTNPSGYAAAVQKGPAPTLFASGDLPPLLASGADPKLLNQLPWFARHAGAAATMPVLARMLEDAAEDPSGTILTMEGAASHSGVLEYRDRMRAWAWAPGVLG